MYIFCGLALTGGTEREADGSGKVTMERLGLAVEAMVDAASYATF